MGQWTEHHPPHPGPHTGGSGDHEDAAAGRRAVQQPSHLPLLHHHTVLQDSGGCPQHRGPAGLLTAAVPRLYTPAAQTSLPAETKGAHSSTTVKIVHRNLRIR